MFAKRNSLTLVLIWIVILAVGTFWYFQDVKKLTAALTQQKNSKRLLEESQKEIRRLTDVETTHTDISHNWQERPKRIISAEEPAFTLSYLNWILQSNNLNIYYDFVLNSKTQKDDVTEFTYTLTGEGTYRDLNRMLWHITYEPILYVINSFILDQTSQDSEYLRFTIKLKGFTVESKEEADETFVDYTQSSGNVYIPNIDVFKPLVNAPPPPKKTFVAKEKVKPTLPKKQPGEINVENASLKAVTANSIFLSEGSSGLKELKLGSSVYLGKLVRIDQQRNEAEFIITKFGKSQRIVLTIDQRK